MAVIESKGDGYSLYNGVKLPSLPVYDKETYPYAAVLTDESGNYYFHVRKQAYPFTVSTEGTLTILKPQVNNANKLVLLFSLVDDLWTPQTLDANLVCSFVWANVDIINTTDNSVYLSASEPISLDGMNVIEWDGDTTGLELMSGQSVWYRVSDKTNVDTSKNGVFVRCSRSDGSYGTTQMPITYSSAGYWQAMMRVRYVDMASESCPTTGCFFFFNASAYLSLFAYYPIEEEPEEPADSISTGKAFLLHQMFSKPTAHALTGKWEWLE